MIQDAAMRALVDFSQAKFFDKPWSRKLNVILQRLLRERNRETAQAQHNHTLARLGLSSGISPEGFEAIQTEAQKTFEELLVYHKPWYYDAKSKQERLEEEYGGFQRSWQNTFGDLNDEATKAKIDSVVRALQARKASAHVIEPMSSGIFNKDTANQIPR